MSTKNDRIECTKQTDFWFQLVDESGNGSPYKGLKYKITFQNTSIQEGILDNNGKSHPFNGVRIIPGYAIITIDEPYQGNDTWYKYLMGRNIAPQKITALQVAAENTKVIKSNSAPNSSTKKESIFYDQIEVSDFIEESSHLPPKTKFNEERYKKYAHYIEVKIPMRRAYGFIVETDKSHIIEIRALRAYRPLLSISKELTALNTYQLAIISRLAFLDFGERVKKGKIVQPERAGRIEKDKNTISKILREEWAMHNHSAYPKRCEDSSEDEQKPHYLMMEDVPYSKRFELIAFDPALNDSPRDIHFIDKKSDTQGFITHNDKIILIAIRGTGADRSNKTFIGNIINYFKDFTSDINLVQEEFKDDNSTVSSNTTEKKATSEKANTKSDLDKSAVGQNSDTNKKKEKDPKNGYVHKGFYQGYKDALPTIKNYLKKFYKDQTIIITGHSLGGAIATLVAAWLTNNNYPKTVLYTYGSPRVASKNFVENYAKSLNHYRIINRGDITPRLPPPVLAVAGEELNYLTKALSTASSVYKVVDKASDIVIGKDIKKLINNEDNYNKYKELIDKVKDIAKNVNKITMLAPMLKKSRYFMHHGDMYHLSDLPIPSDIDNKMMLWKPISQGTGDAALQEKNGRPRRVGFQKTAKDFKCQAYIESTKSIFLRLKNAAENTTTAVSPSELALVDKSKLHDKDYQIAYVRADSLSKITITNNNVYGEDLITHPDLKNIFTQWENNTNETLPSK